MDHKQCTKDTQPKNLGRLFGNTPLISSESIIAGERPDLSIMSGYPQEMKDLITEA